MARVASLYLPLLAIERLRRVERSAKPPEAAVAQRSLALAPIDDDPGACSVPRGGGWRPGARWARDGIVNGHPGEAAIEALPAHQRPTMREMGRRSEAAAHPFKAMPADEGAGGYASAPVWPPVGWGKPMILVQRNGQRDSVYAACPLALDLGLRPGMAAAHARALVTDLDVHDAQPDADRGWLDRLVRHAARHWTPTAAVSGADGIWLDLTGTSHLFGGEETFCRRVLGFLQRLGVSGMIAIAGTPGAAHALARYEGRAISLLPCGNEAEGLAMLPLAALRLTPDALAAAARFGLERVADLYAMPRGPLARRLGLATVRRLDAARGMLAEPIIPVVPFETSRAQRQLMEPIVTAEAIAHVISDLVDELVTLLLGSGMGLRMAVLSCMRVDGDEQRIGFGTARATRDPRHLKRMLALRIEKIEPSLGIETMRLVAARVEPLAAEMLGTTIVGDTGKPELSQLVDQLTARAGENSLFRLTAFESDVPERALRKIEPLGAPSGWPQWKRPVRLLQRPEPLSAVIALLPDHPPRRFAWRGQTYRVVAGDGPERIHGEWWRSANEMWAVRDYFRVEAERGERFWIFRRGDGVDMPTGDLSWHMHGAFG